MFPQLSSPLLYSAAFMFTIWYPPSPQCDLGQCRNMSWRTSIKLIYANGHPSMSHIYCISPFPIMAVPLIGAPLWSSIRQCISSHSSPWMDHSIPLPSLSHNFHEHSCNPFIGTCLWKFLLYSILTMYICYITLNRQILSAFGVATSFQALKCPFIERTSPWKVSKKGSGI